MEWERLAVKYLITGGTGQLGTELTEMLKESGAEYVSFGSATLNIEDESQVKKILSEEKPDVVFHCAAFTAVDVAEDNIEKNWAVNVKGTENVAKVCKEIDCIMVYISTDYVFDGTSEDEYLENSPTNPLNEYGKAKLAGEKVVEETLDKHYIIRTSWVFGQYGSNFVYTMKRLSEKYDELTVINDQIGRPTWTVSLTKFMIHLTDTEQAYGTYHFSNQGTCSWYDFAVEILKDTNVKVKPILTKDYNQKAERPKRSIMSIDKALDTKILIPHWKDALTEFEQVIDK